MINIKNIILLVFLSAVTVKSVYAEDNPFSAKKTDPVQDVIATHPVPESNDLVRQMEELRQQIKENAKVSDEERELGWIYQLKHIGFIDNIEIYRNDGDDCFIKKNGKKPIDSVCLRNYFERMRRSDHAEGSGGNKPARPN